MTRRPGSYRGAGAVGRGDVQDAGSLHVAPAGWDVAYYLVHSLDDADFEQRDAEAARTQAARAA